MENASKALLIAAAMIFAVLVITLLVIFYSQISSYFEEKNKMTEIGQLQEFNAKFENYNDKEIRGNELVSIMNRIMDYNNLQADMQQYERIIINIDLNGHATELSYDGTDLIIDDVISNASNDEKIKALANLSINLASQSTIPGITELKLQKLSSEIGSIVLGNRATEEEKKWRIQKLERILGYSIDNLNINDIVEATKKHYQLTNFKRTVFKCTDVFYDTETGRINGMNFEAVEKDDGKLKMD